MGPTTKHEFAEDFTKLYLEWRNEKHGVADNDEEYTKIYNVIEWLFEGGLNG